MERKYPDIIDKIYKDNPKAKEVLLIHSFSVADEVLAINKNMNLGLDEKFLYKAAMLHDIGIIGVNAPSIYCFGDKPYYFHGVIGAELLKDTEFEIYQKFCINHLGVGLSKETVIKLGIGTEAMEPESIEEKLITYADNFYSKSNLNKKKSFDEVIESLKKSSNELTEKFLEFKKLFYKEQ